MANQYLDYAGLQKVLVDLNTQLKSMYVAQEEGKGLSTNDLTDELLQRLQEVSKVSLNADYVEGNKIATITIDGEDTDIYIPANATIILDDELSDTSENPVKNKGIKKYVDDAIKEVSLIKFEVVTTLPPIGQNNIIYLILKPVVMPMNIYEEYVWIESKQSYEKIGETSIDLTDYVKKSDLVPFTEQEIDDAFNSVFNLTEDYLG